MRGRELVGRFRNQVRPLGQGAWAYLRRLGDRSLSRKYRAWLLAKVFLLIGGITFVLLFLYTLILIPFTPGISELQKAKAERPSVILAADGELLATLKPVNREWVELDQISEHVIDALIATEDHRFYSHHGVDIKRVFGAMWRTLQGSPQGGSTITQQLARNLYPEEIGREVSLTRKLKEMITAFKIEYAYEKDEILLTYLNTVPFYFNAYGIEMAARTYFDKRARDLTLLQSATLVGMLKGTVYYNPVRRPERALDRRNVVLAQMVKRGKLEQAEFERLKDEPLGLHFERQRTDKSRAPHFTDYVKSFLIEWADRNGYNIYRDSLTIRTTLDLRLQRMAERSVAREMRQLQAVVDVEWGRESDRRLSTSPAAYVSMRRRVRPFSHFWESNPSLLKAFIRASSEYRSGVAAGIDPDYMLDSLQSDDRFVDSLRAVKTRLESGMVAIEPETGAVRVWVGSRDYEKDAFDHVARARRQPGSTFKPFVYAAALEEGFIPKDTLPDRKVEIRLRNNQVWSPKNASGVYSNRAITLSDGLAYSKNTITAQLIDRVGAGDVADLAREMGVRDSRLEEVPSLALGTSEVTLMEMVSGYATIAAEGVYHPPVVVTTIEDRHGKVLASFEPKSKRVLRHKTALALIDMMRGVVNRGTGRRIRRTFGIRGDFAGKTGTTQDNADGWFIMMNPKLVAGAWVGFNDPRVAFRSTYWGQGGNNALLVVGDFFRQALASKATGIRGAEFPPAPEYADRGDNLIVRFGKWVGRKLDQLGNWLFGKDEEKPENEEGNDVYVTRERSAAPDTTSDQELIEGGSPSTDSLNRLERDSTRLNEILRQMEQSEDAPETIPIPEADSTGSP